MKMLKRLFSVLLVMLLLVTSLPLTTVAVSANGYNYTDSRLNWRDGFLWGAQMHTRGWSQVYNSGSIMERVHLAKQMGLNLIRIDGSAEDERDLDDAVRLCNAYGIKVMMICYFDYDFYNPCSAQKAAEITEHARSMAERYNGKNGCGKVDFFQLSNEVDCDFIVKQCEELGVGHPSGADRDWYNDTYMANVATYFKAAVAGMKQVENRGQTIINFAYWHYGFLTGMLEEGVDFDVIGHDWYSSMYRPANEDFYNGIGTALIQNFDKPIIICEGNINPSQSDVASEDTDPSASAWDSLIRCLWQAYPMERVIGWNFYEFVDEPERQTQNGGDYTQEAHFGLVKLVNGVYTPKPIYYRLQHIIGGSDNVEKIYVTEPLKRNTYTVFQECPDINIKGYRDTTKDNRFYSEEHYLNDAGSSSFDITKADFIEFDIFSTVGRNLSVALGSKALDSFYNVRSVKYDFSVSDGWTHVVIPVYLLKEADTSSAVGYNPKNVSGIVLFDNGTLTDNVYMHVANFALTNAGEELGIENPLIDCLPNFQFSKYIPVEVTDIYNQIAYRMFAGLERKFDLTNANYVEFDVYVDNPCSDLSIWLCNGYDGYGRRRHNSHLSQAVPGEWTHIVVDLSKDYTGTHGTMDITNLTSIFFEGDPSTEYDLNITIANFAVTKEIPTAKYEHVEIGSVEGKLNSVTVPANTNMYSSYRMATKLGTTLDATKAEYIEMDIYSSSDTNQFTFWMSNNHDSKGRIRQRIPALKKGWNHVVIPIDWSAYQYGTFDPSNFNSFFFEDKPSTTEDVTLKVANLAISVEEKQKQTLEYGGGVVSRYNGYDNIPISPVTDIASVLDPIKLPVSLNTDDVDYIEMNLYINSKNNVTVNLNSTPETEEGIFEEASASYELKDLKYGWNTVRIPLANISSSTWSVNEWFDSSAVKYIYLSGTLSSSAYSFITVEDLALTSEGVTSPLAEGDYNYDGSIDMVDLVHTVNGSLSNNSLWFANVAEISTVKNGVMDASDITALRKLLFKLF